jgi:hypothetical protein
VLEHVPWRGTTGRRFDRFEPRLGDAERDELIASWRTALAASMPRQEAYAR